MCRSPQESRNGSMLNCWWWLMKWSMLMKCRARPESKKPGSKIWPESKWRINTRMRLRLRCKNTTVIPRLTSSRQKQSVREPNDTIVREDNDDKRSTGREDRYCITRKYITRKSSHQKSLVTRSANGCIRCPSLRFFSALLRQHLSYIYLLAMRSVFMK